MARDQRLNDHEERLRQVERGLSTVEGKVFRGVAGYDKAYEKESERAR